MNTNTTYLQKTLLAISILIISIYSFYAQNSVIKGKIVDAITQEPLIGVNVIFEKSKGTSSDVNGNYQLNLIPGEYEIYFKYIGYSTQFKKLTLNQFEEITVNISLIEESNQLDDVVISAGKYEQKLGDVSVSMSVIKPTLIENKATRDAEAIIEQVPGVQVNENQVSIRGGSGWSYGAGSRVLVMVDGMPMLGGDANDIKWTAIPLENIAQIEVLKGASSVLYGSSALNGVINIRTKYPKSKPLTKINLSNGFYMKGYGSRIGTSLTGEDSLLNQRNNQTWWNKPQGYVQANFTHLRKIDDYNDLVLGGFFMKDQGYKYGAKDQRIRLNTGWNHSAKNHKGISYGLNLNTNFNQSNLFFLWANADSVLHALGGTDDSTTTMSNSTTYRIMIDPYLNIVKENGVKHQLKTRFFKTNNQNNTNQSSIADYYFGEYQFQKRFDHKLTITSGAMSSYTDVESQLYGNHSTTNIAGYFQTDKKWNKFNITAGMRMEYFKIDSIESRGKLFNKNLNIPFQPVFRFGGTYQPMEYTFIRASYGQGYRFPSIAEKYISTFVGGLNIFPNQNIQPEHGWSSEIGFKQGFKIGNFKGYLDVSGFITQYSNMMEFMFGFYDMNGNELSKDERDNLIIQNLSQGIGPIETLSQIIGARSTNIQNANIPGFEVNLIGQGNLLDNLKLSVLAGYTFINPIAVNPDSIYLATFSNPNTTNPAKTQLKYRNKHLLKIDFQIDYKKIALGLSTRYTSLMENVDDVFVDSEINILPEYGIYRNARMTGDVVFDARLAYQIDEKSKISILMNNVLNREYTNRPGNVMPPRTLLWQYSLNF